MAEVLHTCSSSFKKFIQEKSHFGPSIDLQIQENTFVIIFRIVIKKKESEGKYSFVKNIIFEFVPHNY